MKAGTVCIAGLGAACVGAMIIAGAGGSAGSASRATPRSDPVVAPSPSLPAGAVRFRATPPDSALTAAAAPEEEIEALVARLDGRLIPEMLERLAADGSDDRFARGCVVLVRRWAETDPLAAANWAGRQPMGHLRREALENVMIMWARADPLAAAEWILRAPDDGEWPALLVQVLSEATRGVPEEAAALALTLPRTTETDAVALRAAAEWAVHSPESAVTWALTIPDEELRARVVGAIAGTWADRDPGAAARCVIERLPEGRPQQDAITGIVQRWRQVDARAAWQWVRELQAGEAKAAALRAL